MTNSVHEGRLTKWVTLTWTMGAERRSKQTDHTGSEPGLHGPRTNI